jgi:hypothetical protein
MCGPFSPGGRGNLQRAVIARHGFGGSTAPSDYRTGSRSI